MRGKPRDRRESAGLGRRTVIVLSAVLAFVLAGAYPALAAGEEGCQNEPVRKAEPYGSALPDCRAYEQVSPTDKNAADAQGKPGLTESSPSGEGVVYYSLMPLPGVEGAAEFPTYLSSFAAGGWSTQGLLPPSSPASPASVLALTEDLDYAIVEAGPQGPLLGEASLQGEEGRVEKAALGERNYYLRNNITSEYRLLSPGVRPFFVDSPPGDSIVLFEDRAKLTEKASSFLNSEGKEEELGGTNLYEWRDGVVRLAGLVPPSGQSSCGPSGPACATPAEGSVGGPGGPAITESEPGMEAPYSLPGGATRGFELQDTVSDDGSRVFFTDVNTGRIYMREPTANRTIGVSSGNEPAYWRAATPDGSYVFYTEGKGANRNLYRFSAQTAKSEAISTGEAHVLGTLGVSSDGSYAYFVAEAVLATNENGHVINEETGEKEKATLGKPNLYEWHDGEMRFIIKFRREEDINNWTDIREGGGGAAEGEKDSRVTPSGTMVLFGSEEKVTSYNNNNSVQLYVYNAQQPLSSGNPTCVSCNFGVEKSTNIAFMAKRFTFIAPTGRNSYPTRNLSSDGSRVFFETEAALVPSDTNGQMDVYEWEHEGTGSCKAGEGEPNGGCLYLISTGKSPEESYFGDASAVGDNVFFFTRQPLVAQDRDGNVDLYSARELGGLESQNVEPAGPCEGEKCRGSSSSAPVFGVPSSTMLSGVGNLTPQGESKVAKPTTSVLTREQKLAAALRACRQKRKSRRVRCRAQAQMKYGTKAKKSNRGGK
jgi:hypothetical protein